MALIIKIAAERDVRSGRYFVAIYSPAEADQPFVTTAPRYETPAAAETDVIAIIAAAAQHSRQTSS